MTTAKRPRGRPSKFTPEIAAEICARLSKGEPMAVICRDEGMPSVQTVSEWRGKDETFSGSIARAREEGFDALAAQCLDIADETSNDTVTVGSDENAREAANTEWIARSKLRIETRLKLLAKWDPKRYGERVHQEHSGELTVLGLAERMRQQRGNA